MLHGNHGMILFELICFDLGLRICVVCVTPIRLCRRLATDFWVVVGGDEAIFSSRKYIAGWISRHVATTPWLNGIMAQVVCFYITNCIDVASNFRGGCIGQREPAVSLLQEAPAEIVGSGWAPNVSKEHIWVQEVSYLPQEISLW